MAFAPIVAGAAGLNAPEHQSKEEILTQPEPAKIRKSSDGIVLKEGSVFPLTNESDDVPFELPHGFGLYFKDCRFLEGYLLALNDTALTVLSSVDVRGFETRRHLTNPELANPGGGEPIAKNTIALRRQRLIRGGVVHELLSLRNHGRSVAHLTLELRFRSKFQDIFVVKGFTDPPRGTIRIPNVNRDRVELSYVPSGAGRRSVTAQPAPAVAMKSRAVSLRMFSASVATPC
jgi:glycogen debranching enzyme